MLNSFKINEDKVEKMEIEEPTYDMSPDYYDSEEEKEFQKLDHYYRKNNPGKIYFYSTNALDVEEEQGNFDPILLRATNPETVSFEFFFLFLLYKKINGIFFQIWTLEELCGLEATIKKLYHDSRERMNLYKRDLSRLPTLPHENGIQLPLPTPNKDGNNPQQQKPQQITTSTITVTTSSATPTPVTTSTPTTTTPTTTSSQNNNNSEKKSVSENLETSDPISKNQLLKSQNLIVVNDRIRGKRIKRRIAHPFPYPNANSNSNPNRTGLHFQEITARTEISLLLVAAAAIDKRIGTTTTTTTIQEEQQQQKEVIVTEKISCNAEPDQVMSVAQ